MGRTDYFLIQLEDKWTTNLTKLAEDELPRIYAKARRNAARKSRLPEDRFPAQSTYTIEDIQNLAER